MGEWTQEGGIAIDYIRNCNVCGRNSGFCFMRCKPVSSGKSAGGNEGEGIIKRKDKLIIRKK